MYFIIFASLKVRIFRVRDYQAANCKLVKLVYYCAASETESLFSLVYSETFNSNKKKLQLKNLKLVRILTLEKPRESNSLIQ